eukprot:COSAG02_NODE_37055_length_447_cov_0.686782_1_plen_47_part_10
MAVAAAVVVVVTAAPPRLYVGDCVLPTELVGLPTGSTWADEPRWVYT